jgi:hypothetical protein
MVNILMCGTLEFKKSQDRVLQALHFWQQSKCSQRSFRVTSMGDGALRPRLQSLVHDNGWQNRARLLGHVPTMTRGW